jgi:hypothetical protein
MLFETTEISVSRSHRKGFFLVTIVMDRQRARYINKKLGDYYKSLPMDTSYSLIFHVNPTDLSTALVAAGLSKKWVTQFVDSVTKMND